MTGTQPTPDGLEELRQRARAAAHAAWREWLLPHPGQGLLAHAIADAVMAEIAPELADLRARAERAEAAVARVREECAMLCAEAYASADEAVIEETCDSILAALDGTAPAEPGGDR